MELVQEIFDSTTGVGRPIVLSIAGLDPTGGAGLLADIKTFEKSGVYGLGISSGNTIQTDRIFFRMEWTAKEFIQQSLEALAARFEIAAIKIGIFPAISILSELIPLLKDHFPQAKIVWDPVLRSSTHFSFMDLESWSGKDLVLLKRILKAVTLLTPNVLEAVALANALGPDAINSGLPLNSSVIEEVGVRISEYCSVLIKGGHRLDEPGTDLLYLGRHFLMANTSVIDNTRKIKWACESLTDCFEKHGSGCVLSAAITAGLAKGLSLPDACDAAKKYISSFLLSNQTLLGLHV